MSSFTCRCSDAQRTTFPKLKVVARKAGPPAYDCELETPMRHHLTPILALLALVFSTAAARQAPQPQPVPAAPTAVARQPAQPHPTPAASQDGISIFYSPKGGCTSAIIEQIGNAKKSIEVQAYNFTSAAIAEALLDAHKRGVTITAVLDKTQRSETYSSATFLANQGMATFIDSSHAIAHNKIMLIDGRTIITGSFNFSKAAEESNAENLLIIQDKADLYRAYQKNFEDHLSHSTPYTGRDQLAPAPTTQILPRPLLF